MVGVDCRSVYGGACYEGLLGEDLYEFEESGDVSGGAGVLFADCARGLCCCLIGEEYVTRVCCGLVL